jgi:Glycosyltransferase family 28 N-terminal domain
MKIGMLTWGTHGDIRPFLALADGLQAAGHEVHLVIPPQICPRQPDWPASIQVCGFRDRPNCELEGAPCAPYKRQAGLPITDCYFR